jgi:hypothetical protein
MTKGKSTMPENEDVAPSLADIHDTLNKVLDAVHQTNKHLETLINETKANRPLPQIPEQLRNPQR